MATPRLPAANIITDQYPYPFNALEQFIRSLIVALFGPGASTVVWRPGGVSSGNVFATWPEIVAQVATMNGDITIAVDDSIAAAIIPAGAWDLRPAGISGPVTLVNGNKSAAFGVFVTIANAAVTIHGLTGLDTVSIDNQSTSNVITVTTADQVLFSMRAAAVYQNALAAGAAFIRVTSGLGVLFLDDQALISTFGGGSNALQVVAPGNLTITINDFSSLDTNMLVSAAGLTTVLVTSPAFTGPFIAYSTQAGAPTIFPSGQAQKGTAPIVVGTGKTAAIPVFLRAASVIVVSVKTPVGDALTIKYGAIDADRVNGSPGSFKISALAAAGGGAINGVDTSTIDWEVVN